MTDLTDFYVTDNVDDVLAALWNQLISSALRTEFGNTETITATKELADSDCPIQVLTPSGANRTVELAPEASTNHITGIANPAASSYNLIVKDDSGATTHATLTPGQNAVFWSTGSAWSQLGGEPGDASAVTYAPGTLADWDSSADPGNVNDGLDQLAERAKDLEGQVTTLETLTAYTPTTAADWDGSADPGDVADALDQLAKRIASPVVTNMLTRAPDVTGQGTWVRATSDNYVYNALFYNSTSADGDNFTINMFLAAGTWTVRISTMKNTTFGIMKVEVGSTNLGNTDLYAAAPNYLAIAEYTGLAITVSGEYAVKFTVNGKNASATDYFIAATQIEFIRTGA